MLAASRAGIICFFLLVATPLWADASPPVQEGFADLRKMGQTPISLSGSWEYYDSLVVSDAFSGAMPPPMTAFADIPGFLPLSPDGPPPTGTYRTRIMLDKDRLPMIIGLRFDSVDAEFKAYANGRLIASNTAHHPLKKTELKAGHATDHIWVASEDGIDLIVHVAGEKYISSGITKPIWIGPAQTMISRHERMAMWVVGLIGVLAGLSIMLVLAAVSRRFIAAWPLAAMGLFSIGWSITIGYRWLGICSSWLTLDTSRTLGSVSLYFMAASLLLFARWSAPVVSGAAVYLLGALGGGFAVMTAMAPASTLQWVLPFFFWVMVLGGTYLTLGVLRSIITRQEGSLLWACGALFLIGSACTSTQPYLGGVPGPVWAIGPLAIAVSVFCFWMVRFGRPPVR